MEQYELDLIAKYGDQDPQIKELWEQHLSLERELERYANKPFLSPQEESQMKEIKKRKLAGKSKLQDLLEEYRKREA